MEQDAWKKFEEGKSFDAYLTYGAHPLEEEEGYRFCVYAPRARKVELIGEFNDWKGQPMEYERGNWKTVSKEALPGMLYKYRIYQEDGRVLDKADPFAFSTELRPGTASRLTETIRYSYKDEDWMVSRDKGYNRPVSIYEVHAGSWKRHADGSWLTYGELAQELLPYLLENHFTHVEFLPLHEHPFDGSWGYQVSGFFSPTSRYGTPEELAGMVDLFHRNGIGVIFDFVPTHFTVDDFALSRYDGTPVYEYAQPEIGYSQWGSCNFDYYKGVVKSFLQSAADYWLSVFHGDGLRMDAVSHAIYWQGQENRGINVGGVEFLRDMNRGLHQRHPTAVLIAEDSSNYLKVTAPVEYDGLGFDYKWDMGWMNDTLCFLELPFGARMSAGGSLKFSMAYFQNELYLLPLSHDENVHGKKTILDKIQGTYEQKFAQARSLYTYMFCRPGKKLNFMGNELGHFREWDENRELDWELVSYPIHDSFRRYFRELGSLYKQHPALFQGEYDLSCFQWVEAASLDSCLLAFSRKSREEELLILINFSSRGYPGLLVSSGEGTYTELLNSDAYTWGGSGMVNDKPLKAKKRGKETKATIRVQLAPFSSAVFSVRRNKEIGGVGAVKP